MFKPKFRRHPLQTFEFWFVILMALATLVAWRLELIALGPAIKPAAVVESEEMPAPPQGTDDGLLRSRSEPARELALPAPHRDAPPALPASPVFRDFGVHSAQFEQDPSLDKLNLVQTASAQISAPNLPAPTQIAPPVPDRDPYYSANETFSLAPAVPAPQPPAATSVDLDEFRRLLNSGDEVAAHRLLSGWYWEHSPESRTQFAQEIAQLAMRIYFQPTNHYGAPHIVQSGERLETLAQKYQVPAAYIRQLNRLTAPELSPGMSLKVIQGPFSVVVDLSERNVTIHAHGYYVHHMELHGKLEQTGTFRVAESTSAGGMGAIRLMAADGTSTPFSIVGRQTDPQVTPFGSLGGSANVQQPFPSSTLEVAPQELALLSDLLIPGAEALVRE